MPAVIYWSWNDGYSPDRCLGGSLQCNETQRVIKQYVLYGLYCFAVGWYAARYAHPPALGSYGPEQTFVFVAAGSIMLSMCSSGARWLRKLCPANSGMTRQVCLAYLFLRYFSISNSLSPLVRDYCLKSICADCHLFTTEDGRFGVPPSVYFRWLSIRCDWRWQLWEESFCPILQTGLKNIKQLGLTFVQMSRSVSSGLPGSLRGALHRSLQIRRQVVQSILGKLCPRACSTCFVPRWGKWKTTGILH